MPRSNQPQREFPRHVFWPQHRLALIGAYWREKIFAHPSFTYSDLPPLDKQTHTREHELLKRQDGNAAGTATPTDY